MSEHKFKPFEKVLVRDTSAGDGWRASFFSHYHGGRPVGINGWMFDRMIPYEGNEHLLGTTDWPEPELKKGDAVLVWDKGDFHKKIRIYSRYDGRFHRHVVLDCWFSNGSADEYMFDFAEKFVPAPVEDSEARS